MAGRRLSSDERRLKILQAATAAFARSGYREASMEEIARAAGITKPVLYDHFASKEALLLAVLEDVRDRLLSEGERALQSSASRKRQVHGAVDAFLSLAENSPDAVKVLVAVQYGDAEAARAARAVQAVAQMRIGGMLRSIAPGAPDWVLSATAQFIMSGLHATALWWLENRRVDAKSVVELIANFISQGVAALETDPSDIEMAAAPPIPKNSSHP